MNMRVVYTTKKDVIHVDGVNYNLEAIAEIVRRDREQFSGTVTVAPAQYTAGYNTGKNSELAERKRQQAVIEEQAVIIKRLEETLRKIEAICEDEAL
jgi:hypothetical protein